MRLYAGKNIAMLGFAYKYDTSDCTESPAIDIAEVSRLLLLFFYFFLRLYPTIYIAEVAYCLFFLKIREWGACVRN